MMKRKIKMKQINNINKKCIKCGIILNQENSYYTDIKRSNYVCKPCKKKEGKKYYNKEKNKEHGRKYAQNHRDKIREETKKYYYSNQEQINIKLRKIRQEQQEHKNYLLNLPDEEFIKVVRKFYKEMPLKN